MSTSLERAEAAVSIGQFLEEAAMLYSESNAYSCGPMRLGYEKLMRQGHSFAAYLQSVGIHKGDRVAVMMPNLPAFPIVTLGVLKAGAVQVNINPMYTASELQHQLDDSGAQTLVVFSGSCASYGAIQDKSPIERVILVNLSDGTDADLDSPEPDERVHDYLKFSEALDKGSDLAFSAVEISRSDLALLQYTGGTTGPSKGAMLTHDNVLSNVAQFYETLPEISREGEEVIVTAIPLYHIFAFTVNMMIYAGIGSHNILITNPRDMDSFIASIKNSGMTVITGVNSLFSGMMMHPDFENVDFSKFKASINGGTAALQATAEKWKGFTGRTLIQGYGLSETSPVLTLGSTDEESFTGRIGKPVSKTLIKLIDENDNEVEAGQPGELVAKGPQVFPGYYEQPEATEAAFTSDGYFRTGDVAVVDEQGEYQIVDRKKDMVIVSGFNVYPNDVEQVAAKCEGVVECACLGVPDEKTGEAVKLFAVKAPDSNVTEADIIAYCREHLTAYKVPKIVAFIDEVPKSAVGKLLRRVLRDA